MVQAHKRLRRFREGLGLSERAAAKAIGVAQPSYRRWERKEAVPRDAYKKAIELWSGGKLPRTMWPLTPEERRAAETLVRLASD